jgi:hypothetical protein
MDCSFKTRWRVIAADSLCRLNGVTVVAILVSVLTAGCSTRNERLEAQTVRSTDERSSREHLVLTSMDLQSMTLAALADASTLRVVSADRVTWRDGSLGCPKPGMNYTQALVPGHRIRIQAGAEMLDYHASNRGPPFLCPRERAKDPIPDTRI